VNTIARNLKYQFLTAINNHFAEGMDKHAIKHAGEMDGTRIFSYADRSNLVDLASGFSEYMKQEYPNIREIRQISPTHVQGFLATKSSTVTQATLDQYGSRFAKLERLVNDSYKSCNVDFHSVVVPASSKCNGKVRTQMLAPSDYQTLLSNTTNTNLHNALVLSYCCGLRASECSKIKASDWHAASGTLKIVDSKGKRSREIKVPQQHLPAVNAVMSSSQGRICDCQTESLQKAFRRQLVTCGLADTYKVGAFHMTRKTYATQLFKDCRNQGMSVQSSLSAVSRSLGHGANRNDLMKQYICCPIQ
jgi:integrase